MKVLSDDIFENFAFKNIFYFKALLLCLVQLIQIYQLF